MNARTRKQYMHPRYGLCVLISPDPEDGALLIMERAGFNEPAPAGYFSCESSDLYHVGERVTGRMEKWVGDADDSNTAGESVTVAVALDDSLADPLGHNVPHEKRRFMWEPTNPAEQSREYGWDHVSVGLHASLRGIVRGGIHRMAMGQLRRIH